MVATALAEFDTPAGAPPNPKARSDAPYGARQHAVLNRAAFEQAKREIASWPGYAPTPLVGLPGLARAIGIGSLSYKDESGRFGLGSFKALGGAYAVLRQLQVRLGDVSSAELRAGQHRARTASITVACATDGNHGRSVAWGARLFGCRCVIYIHETVSQGRADAIARYGAEVRRVPGNYDDAVRQAARDAAANGWIVVSDTSYPGYTDIPRDVMQGYTVMADEALAQMSGAADACLHPGRGRRTGGGGVRPSLGNAGRTAAARGRRRARPRRLPVRIRSTGARRQHPRRARHDDGRARLRRDVDHRLGDPGGGCLRLPDRHRRGGGGVHAPAGAGHRRRSARGRRRIRGRGAGRAAVRPGAPGRWRRRWVWIQGRGCCCSAAKAIPTRRCIEKIVGRPAEAVRARDACRFAAGLAGSGRSIRGTKNMSRIVTVGAAQLGPIGKDEPRRQVVERLVAHLHNAKRAGCDLVVFPELALTTFFPRWFSADQAWVDGGSSGRCRGRRRRPCSTRRRSCRWASISATPS